MAPETQYFSHELTLSPRSSPAGAKFPARLAYWTIGDPSNPAVLMPTCYGGKLDDTSPFLYTASKDHPDPPLPTDKYFLIIVGLLGGGESSSPSNAPAPWSGPAFPHVTYEDNIALQHALCTQRLGLRGLHAYIGFSMGGQQAYHMAALHPGFAAHVVVIAASARTSAHNWCFLEGPRNALVHSVDFHDGHYTAPAKRGLRAFARVYSTWALSPAWFRAESWRGAGFETLEEFLDAYWGGEDMEANDNLAMLWTWQQGDISQSYVGEGPRGDLPTALRSIEDKCLIMPARTDQYFPPEDNEEEVKYLRHGEFSCIETIWGHVAGGGSGTKEDTEFIKKEVKRFLNA